MSLNPLTERVEYSIVTVGNVRVPDADMVTNEETGHVSANHEITRCVMKIRIGAGLLAVVLVLLVPAGVSAQEGTVWGKPILVDDFERARLGDENWEVPRGTFVVKEGKLVTTAAGSTYLFYKQKLPSNMAIEFDGMIPDTTKACDLTAILSANEFEPAIRHYQGAFGTKANTRSAIHRGKVRKEGDEVVASTRKLLITPGKWHHIRAERQDEFVRLFVDGKKVLEFRDRLGFAHASHNRIGLYTYGAPAYFDNIKIYVAPVSAQYKADEAVKWDRVYDRYNKWCIENFGAEKEPLVYEQFGRDLKFIPDGAWRHVSENSACVSWETNLPAKSYVEYGETEAYGKKTTEEERHFYLHTHYLKGLETGKTYHYRVVSVDERGNRIAGLDKTLRTQKTPDAVYIPGDMGKPPYDLNKAGATYVLTEDIVAGSTAFRIMAKDITLDLNGHTITYNEKFGAAEAVPSTKNIRRAFHGFTGAPGILRVGRRVDGTRIFNGFVVQGKAGSGNCSDPLLGLRCKEIAGVTLDYYGYQMNGFIWAGTIDELHHNVVIDKGTELVDRHWAVRAVSGGKKVHHNLIKRCRQRGISKGDEIVHNEIYQDSYATNSLGMSGNHLTGNRVLGGGVHICAIAWVNGMQVIDNLVHLMGERSEDKRWTEYGSGQGSSCNGIRLTQYGGGNTTKNPLYLNNLYSNNLIVVSTRKGAGSRGAQFSSHLQTKNLICRDSTFKVTSLDGKSGGSCIVTQGRVAANALPVSYRNLTLIADVGHIKFGDGYSRGSNHRFENCKCVRSGNRADYHTFNFSRGWTDRHVLLDCEFGEGTRYDDVIWNSRAGGAFYSVAWTLTVKTAPGAKVTIKNSKGEEVFSGKADATGKVSAPLTQCVIRPKEYQPGIEADKQPAVRKRREHQKDMHTPHKVTVEVGGRIASRTVTMTRKQEVELTP